MNTSSEFYQLTETLETLEYAMVPWRLVRDAMLDTDVCRVVRSLDTLPGCIIVDLVRGHDVYESAAVVADSESESAVFFRSDYY